MTPATAAVRIRGTAVPMLLPESGPVHVLLLGEAPGPRGADKSGIPFFGDAAGRHLYAALEQVGAMQLPPAVVVLPWDGETFAMQGLHPVARGVALGNAFNRCPTDDGTRFRAPTRAELEGRENQSRLTADMAALRPRGLTGIVTLGRVAARTIEALRPSGALDGLEVRTLVHPSAQGLLSMAPDRGRGARMTDLQATWIARCVEAVREAGFTGAAT